MNEQIFLQIKLFCHHMVILVIHLHHKCDLFSFQDHDVDAIHPGYGFLSERHDFARACIKHGIKFVGPHPDVMYKMGDKIQARKTAIANNVPVIPGTEKPVKNFAEVSIELIRKTCKQTKIQWTTLL